MLICNKLRSQQSQEVDTASVNAGCVKCDKCYLCRWYVKEIKEFTSYHTNQVFRIKDNITCEDTYVIYLVDCDFHQVSYVGYTTVNMNSRFSNDKSHVKKNKCTCEKVTHLIKEKHDLDFIQCINLDGTIMDEDFIPKKIRIISLKVFFI